jgi:hypothetical protein
MTSASRQQSAIRGSTLPPTGLAAQNLELIAQHHQLDVLHIRATTAPNTSAQQSPNAQVEQRVDLPAEPRTLRREKARPE